MSKRWLQDILLLTLCLGVFYALWLGSHPLMVPDEGRYTEIAREMLVTGNYITPHINGTVLMDKPILHYWLEASALKLFGLNEWAARFWPALIGVFGCLLVYASARVLFDRRTGILSAVILATSPLYFCLAHYANMDLEVGVWISAALLMFLVAIKKENNKTFFYLFYFFIALAFLTKGLIGIILPGLVIGIWMLLLNRWRTLLKMHLITGLLIVLVVAAPWYFLMQQANPDFFNYFFINQQFTRYLSTDFNNAQPVWYYAPILLIGLLPWIILLPKTFLEKISLIWKDKQYYSIELFLLIWPLLIIIFFTLPHSKTIGYVVPVTPPLAILLGQTLSHQWGRFAKWFYGLTSVSVVLLLALTITVSYLDLPTIKPLAVSLRDRLKPTDEVVVYQHYYYDLPFYLQRQVIVVTDWRDPSIPYTDNWVHELWQGSHEKSSSAQLFSIYEFARLWRGDKKVFVFVDDRHYKGLRHLVSLHYFLIGQYQDAFLLSNKP